VSSQAEPVDDVVKVDSVDSRARFPGRAVLIALAGLFAGNVAAVVGYAVGIVVSPNEKATSLLLSEVLLWAGMVGACWWASGRFGSRDFRTDFGVRPRRTDPAWGLLFALVDWVAATAIGWLVSLLGKSYAGSNSNIVTDVRHDVPALAATVVFAIAGAPIVEELFFRGLLQRSIERLGGVPGAILVQGLLFGAVHVAETTGAGRLGLWLSLSAVGVVHGVVYQRFKRITVSMWTHAWFNVTGVVLIFASLAR
jgi:membrane protease YdiL (CAAX protease family)